KDPDASEPITQLQKFFYAIHLFIKWLASNPTFFAIKTSVGMVILAIPAWRPQDHEWYVNWRGQWATLILVLWILPMAGTFVFNILCRIIGAVLGIVVWEMCRGNPYGMAVVCFVLLIPLNYVFFFIPKYRVVALMSKITMILVIAYKYNYVLQGAPGYDKVYTVAGKSTDSNKNNACLCFFLHLLLVIIGITTGAILMFILYLPTGSVELRKRVANTVSDIGKCYGILYASTISPAGISASSAVSEDFKKLATQLHRQVVGEQVILQHTVYETPLCGYFPYSNYKILVEKMDNMSDLVTNMVRVKLEKKRRGNKASRYLNKLLMFLSSILTSAKLISSTLTVKTSLPPYMFSPVGARQRFTILLEKKIMVESSDIANPSFHNYNACLMNGLVFVYELEQVNNVTKDLLGVEDLDERILSRF
ncbi:MAG: hypothetical protein EXX96DRAFT_487378, partial [Benjaminiella poitrasii]